MVGRLQSNRSSVSERNGIVSPLPFYVLVRSMLDTLLYTANITLPIFVVVFLGGVLRQSGFLNDNFVATAARLVFNISMPALLFTSLSRLNLAVGLQPGLIIFALGITFTSFITAWLLSVTVIRERSDRGIFVQGAFRGNLAITGLALADNMYGAEGLGQASLLISFVIVSYNILSIIILEFYASGDGSSRLTLQTLFRSIFSNPLILAIMVSVGVNLSGIQIPSLAYSVASYLADIALPLALLSVGATVNLRAMLKSGEGALTATLFKTVLLPVVAVTAAIALGYRGMTLGILFVLFAAPTAAASFVMAKAIAGKGTLAANIIAMSTAATVLTTSLGIFVLKHYGLI